MVVLLCLVVLLSLELLVHLNHVELMVQLLVVNLVIYLHPPICQLCLETQIITINLFRCINSNWWYSNRPYKYNNKWCNKHNRWIISITTRVIQVVNLVLVRWITVQQQIMLLVDRVMKINVLDIYNNTKILKLQRNIVKDTIFLKKSYLPKPI